MKKIFLATAVFFAMNIMASAKSIVIYFSVTGTTRAVAEKIAKITESEILEIKPKVAYSKIDLNWQDPNSRTSKECHGLDTIRPEIAESIDLSGYDTVYLGYPIWWGQAPNILYTFVENTDFNGKTIYPFCTSGSSGVGSSAKNLSSKSKGKWNDGKRFASANEVNELDIKSWK